MAEVVILLYFLSQVMPMEQKEDKNDVLHRDDLMQHLQSLM